MDKLSYSHIYNIIYKGKIDEIEQNVLGFLDKYATYCDQVLGEGYFGKVYISNFGQSVTIATKNMLIPLPAVIKQAKNVESFVIKKIDDKLYIYSQNGITTEALILFLISKLWYDSLNPHTPFILGIEKCTQIPNTLSKIVIERQGWFDKMSIPNMLYRPMMLHRTSIDTFFATLYDLYYYCITTMQKNMHVKLVNGIDVYLPDLLDNLFISYMHTSYIIRNKLGIILNDQHQHNIFIHWISKNSYIGEKSMKDVEYIYYEIDKNKYIKINTYGLLLKLGDLGTSIVIPNKNVYIIGDIIDVNDLKNVEIYNDLMTYDDMFLNMKINLPQNVLEKTKIYKLFTQTPFNDISIYGRHDKIIPNELNVLNTDIYKDMLVSKIDEKDENKYFIVKL